MIQINHITKSYTDKNGDKLVILNGVEISVNQGEMIAIIGASGSGKSTLLHLMGGLDHPDEGEIYIDGQVVNKLRNEALAEFRNNKIGFVFQFHHLLPEFTALENVAIPALIQGKNEKEAYKLAEKQLELVGLSHRLKHRPAELSGGEQQRVAIARALINEPKVLLADEPTGNLDQKNSESVLELFFQIQKKTNITLILVTHDLNIAKKTNRILELKEGTLALLKPKKRTYTKKKEPTDKNKTTKQSKPKEKTTVQKRGRQKSAPNKLN